MRRKNQRNIYHNYMKMAGYFPGMIICALNFTKTSLSPRQAIYSKWLGSAALCGNFVRIRITNNYPMMTFAVAALTR